MVFCEISSGLGNQLFQYAAARTLALRLKTHLRLDLCNYQKNRFRTALLNHFNIQASTASRFETAILHQDERPIVARLIKPLQNCVPLLNFKVIHEWTPGFDDRILSVEGNVFVRGFWESWRYFAASADLIREELTLRTPPDAANAELMRKIEATESVSLHVRRGDIVAVAAKGALGVKYYVRAAEMLQARIARPHFYIFSDDPEWARANLKFKSPATFVSHNLGKQDHEDLRLMSLCRHAITGNSTFSWWGAWLGRKDKLIFTPSRWFLKKAWPELPNEWIPVDHIMPEPLVQAAAKDSGVI